MLCINIFKRICPIVLAQRFEATKLYISTTPLQSYPDRIQGVLSQADLNAILSAIPNTSDFAGIRGEISAFEASTEPVYATIPYLLRRSGQPHLYFRESRPEHPRVAVCSSVRIFAGGKEIKEFCDVCPRKPSGDIPCVDFVPGSLRCLFTNVFQGGTEYAESN